jgi:hypothetical protein
LKTTRVGQRSNSIWFVVSSWLQDKKLSAKADRSSIDDLQFKIASTGGAGGKEDQSKSDSSGMKVRLCLLYIS